MERYVRSCLRIGRHSPQQLEASLRVPPELQGPRDVAHGGGVVALLLEGARLLAGEAAAERKLPRPLRLEVSLHRELRVEASHALRCRLEPGGLFRVAIERPDGARVADATIDASGGRRFPDGAGRLRASWEREAPRGGEVPGTAMCLACGIENRRGLKTRYDMSERFVWKRVEPPEHFRGAKGDVFPGCATVLLDEIGWWLGALDFGDCGLTTKLDLTLDDRGLEASPLLVLGARGRARLADARGRYRWNRAFLFNERGEAAASADVLFAGSRAYRQSMLRDLAGASRRESLQRAFPGLFSEDRKRC